ncbi:MAG: hypothetical protein H6672_01565 [Anaerolineaceae bacterium]|nr:hypothetical protein [Anaerolineaceae bacterium]
MDTGTRRVTVILGLIMVIAMGSSVILPLLRVGTTQTAQPTATPAPTLPPPITDLSTISLDQTFVHPSGLFTVTDPGGWTPGQPVTNPETVEIAFSNTDLSSVVQAIVYIPTVQLETPLTLDDVDAYWSDSTLAQSWSRYSSWRETSPERIRENDQLIIDFELTLRDQTYVARQISWTDGSWIYNLRVVTLENATDMLKYLATTIAPTLKPLQEFVGTPTDWSAYIDQTTGLAMRFPTSWTITDSAPGRPATVVYGDTTLRLEAIADTAVADETAASTWVESTRPDVSIVSVNPIEREGYNGYSVAYSYTTLDGDAQSGLALLLNGADNHLYTANLRLTAAGVDLNSADAAATYGDVQEALKTFTILPVSAGA